ncbi:succinate-semialdehyde dehydrogenase [Fusarium albosuccineum]|uniref:Succinate-semialdehyde dehydrogenase n=1 Tax=Fusarium albosuccineum TaxID=1237068 RepID=A0A8H4NVV2_9HYPO|nr:succinate-semialdehyde dehydrogenase [Fusarium albosuccineum]
MKTYFENLKLPFFKRSTKDVEHGKEGNESRSRTYSIVHRKWPKVSRKATWWLMPLELAGVVPALIVFAISQPDLYRSDMWQIGWEHKLNSNPAMILYAYANHRPLPKVALIWTRTFTDFNVAISVISLFFLLSKLTAFIMKVWYPILATFINVSMVALYTVSVYGQIGPDHADSRYPAPVAWYWRYGCGLAKPYGKYKACQVAQGSLAVTLYMLVIYLLNLGFAIYAMLPNKINDMPDEEEEEGSTTSDPKEGGVWEMRSMKSPTSARAMPYTPRTQAFHTLDRQLPLRSQQARYG